MQHFPLSSVISQNFLQKELAFCQEKIAALLPRFQDCFPAANTEGLVYPPEQENFEWTTSFFSGMLWLLYEHTGDPVYLPVLEKHLDSFYHRVEDPGYLDTHDLGFLYSLSCYPAVLLQNNRRAEECFLKAAQALRRRFFPQAGIIQAWGDLNDPKNRGRMIIDCLLNLPLLYQAARLTGDRSYWEMAYSHARQAQKYLVRPDRTTYHTFYLDVDTGDRSFLNTACQLLDYYLERLPEDGVCCWDLCFTQGEEPRDSSAAAIVCCGIAGLHLGDFAAHYGEASAHMEAFSRMLWGLAPLWSQGGGEEYLPLFRQGLVCGTDPNHPAYWGAVADYDQKIVEMAAIALTLLLCGERLKLSQTEARNLHRWLAGVEGRALPQNNWLFFRVLVQATFRRMGWPWDREQLEADLSRLEDWYLGDGWYCDGQPSQIDYYIPFGMHYYGLIYARFMAQEDPVSSQRFRERAARFAPDFLYWFEDGGRAVPFGRSLTYRFGQCAFFSALAFAGVEALPWGVLKSRVLGSLRDWFAQPIFSPEGLLTVGYGYPNLCMSEHYNAPGSPYWGLKAFLCLALPETHPFWQSEEQIPVLEPLRLLPQARMLLARSGGQVQLFPSGQSCVCQLGQVGPKYEKLVYSSRFGFSVPRGDSLEEGAFDNCLAVSEAGEDHWRTQRGFEAYELAADHTWRRYSPMRGVQRERRPSPVRGKKSHTNAQSH